MKKTLATILGYLATVGIAQAVVTLPPTTSVGSLLYGTSTVRFDNLATGTAGYILTMNGGVPKWMVSSASGLTNIYAGSGISVTSTASSATITNSAPSQWTTSSTDIYRLTGNVGIGISSPKFRLHVSSATTSDPQTLGSATGGFNLSNSNGAYGLQMGVLSTGNAWIQSERNDGTATAYNLSLQPLGGNVGIGTTTAPVYTLDVRGTGNISNTLTSSSSQTNLWTTLFYNPSADSSQFGVDAQFNVQKEGASNMTGAYGSGGLVGLISKATNNGSSGTVSNAYGFIPTVQNINAGATTTNAYSLFIPNTYKPSGSIGTQYGEYIATQSNGSTDNYALYVQGAKSYFGGNVGIGASSPLLPLDVTGDAIIERNGSGYTNLYIGGASTSTGRTAKITKNYDSPYDLSLYGSTNTSNVPIYFYNDNGTSASKLTIATSGNVGIGTTAPAFALDVQSAGTALTIDGVSYAAYARLATTGGVGQIFSTDTTNHINAMGTSDNGYGLSFYTRTGSANYEKLRITNAGNVGIGTTTPATTLHVVGNTTLGTLNGILKGTNGLVGTATSGTDYTLMTAFSCPAGQHVASSTSAGVFTCSTDTSSSSGVSTSSPFSAGYIPMATSGTAITNSNIFQSGSNLGIGTTTPANTLSVNGNVQIASSTAGLIFGDGTKQTTAGVTKTTNLKSIQWSESDATSTNIYDSPIFTFQTTSTIDKIYVSSRDTANTFNWNLGYATDPTSASSTWYKLFTSTQTTTSTPTTAKLLIPNASSTPNLGDTLLLHSENASTTLTTFTIWYHEQ